MKRFFITFKQATCGNCGTLQDYFRIPANWHQFLWGGYTCKKCGAELDKSGKVIKLKDT